MGHADATTATGGPAESGTGPQTCRAWIDVYSGRSAPAWTLTDEEARDFRTMLNGLTPGGTMPPTGLGYRGVVVRLTQPQGMRVLRAWRGVVALEPEGRTVLTDGDRSVERFLWGSARRHLPAEDIEPIEPLADLGS